MTGSVEQGSIEVQRLLSGERRQAQEVLGNIERSVLPGRVQEPEVGDLHMDLSGQELAAGIVHKGLRLDWGRK